MRKKVYRGRISLERMFAWKLCMRSVDFKFRSTSLRVSSVAWRHNFHAIRAQQAVKVVSSSETRQANYKILIGISQTRLKGLEAKESYQARRLVGLIQTRSFLGKAEENQFPEAEMFSGHETESHGKRFSCLNIWEAAKAFAWACSKVANFECWSGLEGSASHGVSEAKPQEKKSFLCWSFIHFLSSLEGRKTSTSLEPKNNSVTQTIVHIIWSGNIF